jgi:hypothetical protein
MQSMNTTVVKKTEPILIKSNHYLSKYYKNEIEPLYTQTKQNDLQTKHFDLKQNCFDPTKFSPPNQFMIKLYMRMNNYYDKNEDIFVVK